MDTHLSGGRRPSHREHPGQAAQAWRYAAAGLCSSLVGLGLARFAYAPLIPALIAAKWFSAGDVVYLGAANLAGYLAGALAAGPIRSRIGATWALRAMMACATLTFFACSAPVSFLWFFCWRFLAGLAGGVIMVLAASAVLPHVAPERRGFAGGMIFSGVGLGVAASGTLVPLMLREGLRESWYGLGVLAGLLTLASWWAWPPEGQAASGGAAAHRPIPRRQARAVRALLLEYGLNACALVPHMVFIVDFIARGLGQGIAAGAQYWVVYGIGAIVGPLITGHLADRAGFGPALRLAFLIEAVAVFLPSVSTSPLSLIVSCVIIGGFTPGIVPLTLGRIHELLPHSAEQQRATWGHATTSFALFQAGSAYGFSWLFQDGGNDYLVLFRLGAVAVVVALAIDLAFATSNPDGKGTRQ